MTLKSALLLSSSGVKDTVSDSVRMSIMDSEGTIDTLLMLPEDLLLTLPYYLHDIRDFNNLAMTGRYFYGLLAHTSSRTILHLAVAASRALFRPDPHFLVAATARQVISWATLCPEHTVEFRMAFRRGKEGLLDLALRHTTGLTLERIRELYEMRSSTINPITDLIDKCIGEQWASTPDFWNGGVDDSMTLYASASETFFHLVIYGELFAPAFDSFLDTGLISPSMDVETRLEFLKYCLPDWTCWRGQDLAKHIELPDGSIDPRRAVETVGPYAPLAPGQELAGFTEPENQVGLKHLLASTRWNPPWREIRAAAGGDFVEEWKQHLWWTIVMCQGLEGMVMIRAGGLDAWKERLVVWRRKIEAMTERPAKIRVGTQETYIFPDLKGDLSITTSGYSSA